MLALANIFKAINLAESTPKPAKQAFMYKIFTTDELEKTIFCSAKIKICRGFVKFNPFDIQQGFNRSENKEDTTYILPERVISKIVKMQIDFNKVAGELVKQQKGK